MITVASLGLVSPGAAINGCHPIFSKKNLTIFLVIASESDDLLCRLLTTPIFPRRWSFEIQPQKIQLGLVSTP